MIILCVYVQCKNTEEVAIDWVDEAVCHQGLIRYSILDQRSPNPLLCSEAHTHAFRHCIPLSHTCTLHSPKVYTLFKATRCLRGQIAKLCLFKTLNPQTHTLFSGDTHY